VTLKKKAAPAVVTTTEAIVLRRFDFSENSQVGHLFTRQLGRVSVLARGIKRPGPDLRGPLDLFSRAETRLRQRRGDLQLNGAGTCSCS
jgi:recombinational DNA repair protein (RecF pathway)